ncbi:MAG: hypothetical protein ACE15E_20645 [Acidobacteriota bacterium]
MARGRRYYDDWYPTYTTVASREKKAQTEAAKRTKKGARLSPVKVHGLKMARTFWGSEWCTNLESYRDYENRLPRGRSYVRHGSVIDLQIQPGKVEALVVGTECYEVSISIARLAATRWKEVRERCSGEIGSLVELLQGKLSDHVMRVITDRKTGLFPAPAEIRFSCSCPDWAVMCKHVAAVMYGIGARLDEAPELFFTLRQVDHRDLITSVDATQLGRKKATRRTVAESELSDVFGIEIEATPTPAKQPAGRKNQAPGSPKSRSRKKPRPKG